MKAIETLIIRDPRFRKDITRSATDAKVVFMEDAGGELRVEFFQARNQLVEFFNVRVQGGDMEKETVRARFEPLQTKRPKCSNCGCFIDKGNAVLEYQCRNCYVDEICIEISHLIYETSKTVKVPQYDLLHKAGMFMAIAKFRKLAKGETK